MPARSLELDRRCGLQLLHFATAMRTFFQVRSRNSFDLFRLFSALHTFVLVQWHCCSLQFWLEDRSIARTVSANAHARLLGWSTPAAVKHVFTSLPRPSATLRTLPCAHSAS